MPMSSGGHVESSSDCATRPKAREIGLTGYAVPIQPSLHIGRYVMATAEHREPCDSRGSRTVLGAPGGEIPPGDSTTIYPLDCPQKSRPFSTRARCQTRRDPFLGITEAEKRIEQLCAELVHLDAVLRMFRPDFKAEGLSIRHRRPTKSPISRTAN